MQVVNLFSGSKGNATYLNIGGKNILIDCGKNYKQINQNLLISVGIGIEDIDMVFITHAHGDHTGAMKKIYKDHKDIKFIMAKKTFYGDKSNERSKGMAERLKMEYDPERISFIESDDTDINDFIVEAFVLRHDEFCVGYIFTENVSNESLCFISDNGGYIDGNIAILENHTYYLVESNYDTNMAILDTKRRPDLKRRNLNAYGHTDNVTAIKNLLSYVGENTRAICFMHLSEDCNNEELAREIHRNYIEIWNKEELFSTIDMLYAQQKEYTEVG